jgi:putative membrane protein
LPHAAHPAASEAAIGDGTIYGLIFAAAAVFWRLTRIHPYWLPFWAPWDFSFVEFLSGWLAVFWYLRGLARTRCGAWPSVTRRIAFFAGVAVIYVVLETHFEYLAEHQFFYNRIQHVAMHHVGPLLLALSWPGETLMRGAPVWLHRVARFRPLRAAVNGLQRPALAALLFVGSFFFWLIPPVHFRAMVDPRLFALMNWTMVLDGILFWCLVLDLRASPPARIGFVARAALAGLVMFPQIIGGALIAFSSRDLYTYYNLCGRIYPEMGAHYDQLIGGLIVWIPPGMMSVAAVLLIVNGYWRYEERVLAEPDSSARWDNTSSASLADCCNPSC